MERETLRQKAAREAAALGSLSRLDRYELRWREGSWERLMITDLKEAADQRDAGVVQSATAYSVRPQRFPAERWGFLDVPQIAEPKAETWTVPTSRTDRFAAIAARQAATAKQNAEYSQEYFERRGRCAQCQTTLKPADETWMIKLGIRVSLCPACFNSVTAKLRVYTDQMRNVQYHRGRYTSLKANPASLYCLGSAAGWAV
jgi:hypothetical protein